jgi:hypothetical protein
MTTAPGRPLIRGALLSARLFADALETPVLRYGGLSTMPIEDALDILKLDGTAERSRTSWLTRFRLAKVIREQLPKDDELAVRLDDLARTTFHLDDEAEVSYGVACGIGSARPRQLSRVRKWKTTGKASGSATVIYSMVEVRASYLKIALMADPRRWAENSLFWYESSRLGDDGHPEPPLDRLDPDPKPDLLPISWKGVLRERVAGVGLYTAHLDISYDARPDETRVEYTLNWTPDNLKMDEGSVKITPLEDGWVRGEVEKKVDFTDNPYGGPSAADLIAPSYLGSWLRVQQDLWIAVATDPKFIGAN